MVKLSNFAKSRFIYSWIAASLSDCLFWTSRSPPILSRMIWSAFEDTSEDDEALLLLLHDKCNFYMIFIILLFIKIVSFPLFLLIWFDFYLYLSIHLCFEGMWRFQINLQGLYMQSGARPIESSQLTSSQHEFKRRPTQLNSSLIGARNQKKFAPNPSPIWVRIPACTLVSIFSITFCSDIQSRWSKLGWKVNLKGYNFLVYQKSELWR